MAFVPVLSFLVLLVFGSVSSWASCFVGAYNELNSTQCNAAASASCVASCSAYKYLYSDGHTLSYTDCHDEYDRFGTKYCTCARVNCSSSCAADSLKCVMSGMHFDSQRCECLDSDTTYHCQNSGGAEAGGFGSPERALMYRCVDGVCTQTTALAGTCQDWGFCPDGTSDCDVPKDSTGRPPCRRSGVGTTSGTECYYHCADGRHLKCRPSSTQYVAGAIYVGTCPERPSLQCDPPRLPPLSSSASPSSSASSGTSSGSGGDDTSSGSSGDSSGSGGGGTSSGSGGGDGDEKDYTPILLAILDTVHNGNVQRGGLLPYVADMSGGVKNVDDNTFNAWREVYGLRNDLTAFKDRSLPIAQRTSESADSTASILREISNYLHSDSMLQDGHDTTYNPLLRDIKNAIDSVSVNGSDSSGYVRDSAFVKWWSNYAADSAAQNGVLGKIYDNVVKNNRDSVKNANCNGFNGCLAVYKDIRYCSNAWGVSTVDCVDGGSPFDNVLNVEGSILSTIWDAIWGEDSTELDNGGSSDTNVTFSPAKDTAQNWLTRAFNSVFGPDSVTANVNKLKDLKDSALAAKNDTTKIQPDSLWRDSSEVVQYVENLLLPSGISEECFICHAELGTLNGLAPDGLTIHIDFADFGGFNFCALFRIIVKIITTVILISMTLGSWAAAFGYNPKNDA